MSKAKAAIGKKMSPSKKNKAHGKPADNSAEERMPARRPVEDTESAHAAVEGQPYHQY